MKLQFRFAKFVVCALLFFVAASLNAQQKRAVIGISSAKPSSVKETYVNAVRRAGGIPLIIPITSDKEELAGVLAAIDGLILTGGEDVEPARYGENPHPQLGKVYLERDEFDISLARMALSAKLPILGICRGAQVLNVAFGGSLYQDIPSQLPDAYAKHRVSASNIKAHRIDVKEGTILHKLIGPSAQVNTSHHQAVKKPALGFVVSAVSEDGVVEAIEMKGAECVIGVQFHPEGFVANGDDSFLPLFRHLVQAASKQ